MSIPPTEIVLTDANGTARKERLPHGEYLIGREEACELRLEDESVSGRHALLSVTHTGIYVEDLGSSNYTLVNGTPVLGRCRIWHGQKIQIGSTMIQLQGVQGNEISKTVSNNVPGTSLGIFAPSKKYEISRVAAEGGMGTILEVRETATERSVALKVMKKSPSAEAVSRFIAEAKITACLEHPNIVPVHDLDTDSGGKFFYTMKFVRGITLQEILENLRHGEKQTLSEYSLASLLTIFQKICDALSFAHSKGVIHRDLKPENIMIGDYGEVLVMDWGVAKKAGDQTTSENGTLMAASEFSTMSGLVMGTPQYMSPEQARGEIDQLDERTDIYSLGAILYQIIFLRPPVEGKSPDEVIRKSAKGEVAPCLTKNPVSILPHLEGKRAPESLCAVIGKAMSFDKKHRYQSVKQLQSDVAAFQNGFATSAENANATRQLMLLVGRHKAASITAATALVIATLLTTGFLLKVTQERNSAVQASISADRERKRAENALIATDQARSSAEQERKKAQAALVSLQKTAPDFYALAQARLNEGRIAEAIQKVGYAEELDDSRPEYHLFHADLLQSSQNLAAASQEYRRVLALRPNDEEALHNLALCDELLRGNNGQKELSLEVQKRLLMALREQHRLVEAGPLAAIVQPDAAIAEATLRARLHDYTKQPGWRDDRIWQNPDGSFGVSLERLGIGDLSVLKDQNITELNLSYSNIQDLSALAGLPLKSLKLNFSQVLDLAPLKGMPLESLELFALPVTDLEPLIGMKLSHLLLNQLNIRSLGPLAGMPLQFLSLENTRVTDLSPLKGAPLTKLNIAATHIMDLSPLSGLPLQSLDMSFNQIATLEPLSSCTHLQKLFLSRTRVFDLSPLRGLKLTDLDISNTNVVDLSPLSGLPLQKLSLLRTYVEDLKPLSGISTLRELIIPPGAHDVASLRSLPLQFISTTIKDDRPAQTAAEFWKEYDLSSKITP